MQNLSRVIIPAIAMLAAGAAGAAEQAAVKAARLAVGHELRDPGSARFEEVRAVPGAVCGWVNARNGAGGYAGRMLFVYVAAERRAYVLDPAGQQGPKWAAAAAAAYQRHCP